MRLGPVVLGLALLASGCARPQSTLAHGHPVDYWVQALHDPSPAARRKAVDVLGNVGAGDPAVLPALTAAMKDRDGGVRGAAVLALLRMGPAAQDACPALEEAQKDRDPRVRSNATKALRRIRGDG
jgi:HEAT repeat protein